MVIVSAMHEHEYPAYCRYFIDDYSREIVENYGHPMEVAIELAKQDLQRSFPLGLASKGHDLLCIRSEINQQETVIGYLWHCVNRSEKNTFIYDFYLFAQYRGQGLGKQALQQLEIQLHSQGIKQIKLRVAYHNSGARKLYQSIGFNITGYNMAKNLVP